MLIISQDKRTILNFSNIQNIRIEDYGTHQKGVKIYKIYAGNFEGYATLLGTYKTEERAKEVLNEIIQTKTNFEYYKYADESHRNEVDTYMRTKYNFFDTYEMPIE